MARMTKKDIYATYDIQFDGEKIYCDLLDMWVQPLLINGNEKIGRGVWHFSTLAGKGIVSDEIVNDVIGKHAKLAGMTADELRAVCGGTCCCNCPGCYAQAGNYQYDSVIVSLARKSLLSRVALEWVERAINAQIAADRIEYVRIHASGDFVSADYVNMWTRIGTNNPNTIFWTYTKTTFKECAAFTALQNCNIVESLIDGKYINYGPASYIVQLYDMLKENGEDVYLCRCGIDSQQHCTGCHHCYSSRYVLFLEHSTGYDKTKDPMITEYIKRVLQQDRATVAV